MKSSGILKNAGVMTAAVRTHEKGRHLSSTTAEREGGMEKAMDERKDG